MRFAIFGTGFWARYQLAAWREVPGAEPVALYNRTRAKAEALAREFGVPTVYDDPEALLANEQLDFVDIISDPDTHGRFVRLAADRGLPVICQKPLAPTLAEAEEMAAGCRAAGVPLLVHENWRWQAAIRALRAALDTGAIGRPFRARLDMISGFPVFANQPFLATVERFILADLGVHILDVARFLFGEAERVYCRTQRVHRDIAGEDVATVLLTTASGVDLLCELAYAENPLEREVFPQTLAFIEGERGSIELGTDYWLRVTTADGTHARRYPPPRYAWANPAYDVIHASIVPCHENLLGALRGEARAETTAEDNVQTLRLVEAAYESAATGRAVVPGAAG